ncbi:MAG TPA: TetR/AcrR family transcriptional regulator [Rhizobiaceae bacterium]|nr:TetR/AcrR family transcriptional regulator [Rhizobiaceae bacterium]
MTNAVTTRDKIMDIAEGSILAKGFNATSIEEIIAAAGITKSGFFYHFPDKSALAKALLLRYFVQEKTILDDIFNRGRELSEDPLQGFLISLKLFAEAMYNLPEAHPGCLIATYCYQDRMFDQEIRQLMREGVLEWRERFLKLIGEIEEHYQPRDPVDREALADMINTVIEGGIVMSKALNDPRSLGDQVMLFRSYIKLLYEPRSLKAA